MKPKIVIVEDGEDFTASIVDALEKLGEYKFDMRCINPSKIKPAPTFEQLHDLIEQTMGARAILLLDNRLGWKWTGAHLAPSFDRALISISSDPQKWAERNFTDKHNLRTYWEFKENESGYIAAIAELNTCIREVLAEILGPNFQEFLEPNVRI